MSQHTNSASLESLQAGGWTPASSTEHLDSANSESSSTSGFEEVELPSSPHYSPTPDPQRPARTTTRPARKMARPPRKARPASDLTALERAVADAKAGIVKANARYATALRRKHQAEAHMAAEKERRKAALEKELEDLLAVEKDVGDMATEMEEQADVSEQELHKLLHA